MAFPMVRASSFLAVGLDFSDEKDDSRLLFSLEDGWFVYSDWDEVEWGSAAMLFLDDLLLLMLYFDQKLLNSLWVME